MSKEVEVEFAKGADFTEASRLRVTYTLTSGGLRFPVVYHTWGDDTVTSMEFTEGEARWLGDVLARLFREHGD